MKKTLPVLLSLSLAFLAGCSRCVASDDCNAEGKGRVAEINVATIPSVTLRYNTCDGLHYREIGFGANCKISWQ